MPPPCHPSRKSDRCQRTLPSTEGKTYRDSRFPGDARHALYSREAHGAGRAWEALDAAGAVGTLDALRAQLPSTARLEENRTRWVGGKQCPAAAAPPPSQAGLVSPLDFVVGMAAGHLPLLWVRLDHRDPAREQLFTRC